MAEFAGDAVAQIAKFDESRLERGAGLFRGLPDGLPLGEVGARGEQIVDLIYGDRSAVQFEFEAVENGRLFRFGGDAVGDDAGDWSSDPPRL